MNVYIEFYDLQRLFAISDVEIKTGSFHSSEGIKLVFLT